MAARTSSGPIQTSRQSKSNGAFGQRTRPTAEKLLARVEAVVKREAEVVDNQLHRNDVAMINDGVAAMLAGWSKTETGNFIPYFAIEAIAVQRVQELVSELYLSEGKARQRHWKHLATHLSALGVKQDQIDHLTEQDKPELVANLLKQLMGN